MKKTLVCIALYTALGSVNAASIDNISISGFGSVAVGKSNNDVGYTGYDSEEFNFSQDSLAGVQLNVDINENAKFVGQVVANGLYDYDLSVEMAYISYEFDALTVRAGKLRAPLFMYSDYLDVGYAYPMLRPSVELYDNFKINSYNGVELLIPIEFENSSLLIQPIAGISSIAERDSDYGKVTLDSFLGGAVHWYVEDFTFRASYVQATTDFSSNNDNVTLATLYNYLLDDKKGKFISLGAQYDNSELVAITEATDVSLADEFSNTLTVSGLLGYRFGSVMPYVMANWVKTTDDEKRENSPYAAYLGDLSYKSTAYSVGGRWDFAQNIALKADITYADFHGTTGSISATEDNSVVYSAAVDFIF